MVACQRVVWGSDWLESVLSLCARTSGSPGSLPTAAYSQVPTHSSIYRFQPKLHRLAPAAFLPIFSP
jgi:hypothetical protein